jgi:hypothetical protein
MNGATMKVYVKATQSLSIMESSLGSESNVFDNKAGNGFILKESGCFSHQKRMENSGPRSSPRQPRRSPSTTTPTLLNL